MEKFEFNVQPNENGEIIIRQGAAAQVYDPVPVTLKGTITAPADYAAWEVARLKQLRIDGQDAVEAELEGLVAANYTNRTIQLTTKPREKCGITTVTGTLALHPSLAALLINADKTFDEKGLLRHLKFHGAYFKDREKHGTLLESLKKFKAKVEQQFENADDYKGAAAQSKLTKITHDVPLEFTLCMPIFGGGEKQEFKVEICVGLSGSDVEFWLESVALADVIVTQTEAVFEEQLKRLEAFAIVKQY